MERLYCTDLDNTIICGQQPNAYGICVAVKNGKNASFMNNESYDKFISIVKKIKTLPVTTRCEKSYNNIYLKRLFDYALVENGAVLVTDKQDEYDAWLEESRSIVSKEKSEFETVRGIIESFGYKEKWGSEFVLDYTNKDITDSDRDALKIVMEEYKENFLINIGKTSIVCTYKKLSKGVGIKRFAKKYSYDLFLSTGDNLEDESMFKETKNSIGKNNAEYVFTADTKLEYCDKVIDKVIELI